MVLSIFIIIPNKRGIIEKQYNMNEQEKTMLNKLIAIMEQNRNEAKTVDAYEVYAETIKAYKNALQNEKWTGNENIGETIEQEYEWQLAHI